VSINERFSEKDFEVLKLRAQRAASVSGKEEAETSLTAIQIALGGETYALPVENLRAIYESVAVVTVPGTPAFIAGIANIRGRILPVLDLAVLLGVPGRAGSERRTLVGAAHEAVTMGVLVQAVGEVVGFSARDLTPIAGSADATHANYLRGMLSGDSVLLDIAAILGDPDLIINEII